MNIKEFFNEEYISFSNYDNVRKIASYVDGMKNSQRKVLHTLMEKNIKDFQKVSNLGPKVQEFTQYLHGSLEGGIVNMTANYVGSGNNFPILEGDGNFGSAFIPRAAATRYIFARQNPDLNNMFNSEDNVNLEQQMFEGDKIEPKFYVPTIPFILANQLEGMSIGFAQKILPRKVSELSKWVRQKAAGEKITADLSPFWNGMACTIAPGDGVNKWVVSGSFERIAKNRIKITSIPVGIDLKQYQTILDKLVDTKVIRNYEDTSDNDVFEFEIYADKDFVAKSDDWLLTKLKLTKSITENFTCIDANNKIVQFETVEDLLESWWEVRQSFNAKRKSYKIAQIQNDLDKATLKSIFITGVVEGKIELRNKSVQEIQVQSIEYFDGLDNVNPYVNLPLRSLTVDEIAKLRKEIKALKASLAKWKKITENEISLDDIKNLNESL